MTFGSIRGFIIQTFYIYQIFKKNNKDDNIREQKQIMIGHNSQSFTADVYQSKIEDNHIESHNLLQHDYNIRMDRLNYM